MFTIARGLEADRLQRHAAEVFTAHTDKERTQLIAAKVQQAAKLVHMKQVQLGRS